MHVKFSNKSVLLKSSQTVYATEKIINQESQRGIVPFVKHIGSSYKLIQLKLKGDQAVLA